MCQRQFVLALGGAVEQCRQVLHDRVGVNPGNWKIRADFILDPSAEPDGHQRMAADFEEIVVPADAVALQDLGPQRRQTLLDLALRRLVATAGVGRTRRRRQRPAVQLAVRRQRQPLQRHIRRRHHVVRQCRRQVRPQGFRGDRGAGVVADKALLARAILARQDHGVPHPVERGKPGLDLAEFDAEAADLHLVVVAAEIFQRPVRQVAAEVTGPVHPCPRRRAERIRQEPLRRQLRTVQVAAGKPGPADIQLPGDTDRNRLAERVEQVDPQVRDTLADRAVPRPFRIVRRQRPVGHVHRGFGDPVHVDQLRVPVAPVLVPRPQHADLQRLAAEDDVPQPMPKSATGVGLPGPPSDGGTHSASGSGSSPRSGTATHGTARESG